MATIPVEQQITPEKVAAIAEEHDGCLHIRLVKHELEMQLYPLDDGETPIAGAGKVPIRFEMVFRPPTGREMVVFKKRQKTAAAETADEELFKGCVIYPEPEAVSKILARFSMLFSSKSFVNTMMALGGAGTAVEGKG